MLTHIGAADRLLNLREVLTRTGKARSGVYASMRADPPTFPRPIKDGFSSRWLESEVLAWIQARIAARDGRVGK